LIPLGSLIQDGRKKVLHSLDENDPDRWLTEHPHVEPMLQWVIQHAVNGAISAGRKVVTRKIVRSVCLMWKSMSEEEKASALRHERHKHRRAKSTRRERTSSSRQEDPLHDQQRTDHAESGEGERPRGHPIASRERSNRSNRTSSTVSRIASIDTSARGEEEEGERNNEGEKNEVHHADGDGDNENDGHNEAVTLVEGDDNAEEGGEAQPEEENDSLLLGEERPLLAGRGGRKGVLETKAEPPREGKDTRRMNGGLFCRGCFGQPIWWLRCAGSSWKQ